MTVAFLILAFDQPDQLRRLGMRLAAEGARTILHLDRKADRATFAAKLAGVPLTILPESESYDVYWGGHNMLLACLAVLRVAIADPDVTHAVLLSGNCYPVRPTAEIVRRVAAGGSHIPISRKLEPRARGGHNWFVGKISMLDSPLLNPRTTPFPRLANIASEIIRAFPRRNLPLKDFYHGGTWWTLARAEAQQVLDFTNDRPEVLRWFRHVRIPDEIYPQSLLMADPAIAARLAGEIERNGPSVTSLTYTDWSVGNPHRPKVLGIEDLDAIRASGSLFARKIHPERSAALIGALDRES
ncbi:MAG: beta-1,6-N-acetylglucosaminyltransferase [Devosia sp.]